MNLPSYYLSFAQQMGIDVADIVRLDKFKFINKDFPLASILIHESPFNKIRVGRDGDGLCSTGFRLKCGQGVGEEG